MPVITQGETHREKQINYNLIEKILTNSNSYEMFTVMVYVLTKKCYLQDSAALYGKRQIWAVKYSDEVTICNRTKEQNTHYKRHQRDWLPLSVENKQLDRNLNLKLELI